MIYYFDTSALLKRYFNEKGTANLVSLFNQKEVIAATSAITWIEGYHVICRKALDIHLSLSIRNKLLKTFLGDLKDCKIVPYHEPIIKLAQKIILKKPIKTLDAIHIASALFLKKQKLTTYFTSSDTQQNTAARDNKLKTWDPAQELTMTSL